MTKSAAVSAPAASVSAKSSKTGSLAASMTENAFTATGSTPSVPATPLAEHAPRASGRGSNRAAARSRAFVVVMVTRFQPAGAGSGGGRDLKQVNVE